MCLLNIFMDQSQKCLDASRILLSLAYISEVFFVIFLNQHSIKFLSMDSKASDFGHIIVGTWSVMVLRKITVKKTKKPMGCRHAALPEYCLLNACLLCDMYIVCYGFGNIVVKAESAWWYGAYLGPSHLGPPWWHGAAGLGVPTWCYQVR